MELKEYRKRLSWVSSGGGSAKQSTTSTQPRTGSLAAGSNDFQFQFPKFGDASNAAVFGNTANQIPSPSTVRSAHRASSTPSAQSASPAGSSMSRHSIANVQTHKQNQRQNSASGSPKNNITHSPPSYNQYSIDSFSGLFSPSILEATRKSANGYFGFENNEKNTTSPSRGISDNSFSSVPGLYSSSSVSNTESPGSLSDAHNQISSIDTSPEPIFNSPYNKVQDLGLNTINEEGTLGQWNCK